MNPRSFYWIVRDLGWSWTAWRGLYALALRSGYFRRVEGSNRTSLELLARAWGVDPSRAAVDISALVESAALPLPGAEPGSGALAIADPDAVGAAIRIMEGDWPAFSWQTRAVGDPPGWFAGEPGRESWPADRHWSGIEDLGATRGDIKEVWEPARFTMVSHLLRAAGREPAMVPALADYFLSTAENWIRSNPPHRGPHWRCGQEAALRTLAWLLGIGGLKTVARDPQRTAVLVASLWAQVRHIERVHWYARRCVRNNHAISEAAALYSVGISLPFLPRAARWMGVGARSLTREVSWQILPDGGHIQGSLNYGRLVLQLLTWVLNLAANAGVDPPPLTRDALVRIPLNSATDSARIRPPSPTQIGHPFRGIPATCRIAATQGFLSIPFG